MKRAENRFVGHGYEWVVIGSLLAGCASSIATHRDDDAGSEEAARHLVDERAYKDAAEKFLVFLAQQPSGPGVMQVSGTDGIYPMYECMEHGCPDRVLCKKANVYCHVTHCGQGRCRGCPEPFPEDFKNLLIKEWCKFDCQRGAVRAGTALGFVSSLGGTFVGPFGCPDE